MSNHVSAGPRQHVWARIFHWTNLIAMILLILTGLHVKIPFSNMFGVHFFAGVVLVINIPVRMLFLFVGKYADWHQWGFPTPKEYFTVIRHYLFMGPKYDVGKNKYNALQRTAYVAILALIIFQGLTGWALAFPTGALAGLVDSLGGIAAIRGIHILCNWIFIAFTLIHAYMVYAYDPAEFAPMFWGTKHQVSASQGKKSVSA